MTALVKVELRRLLSRRLLRGLTVLALVGFAIAGVAAFVSSDDSPAAVARADARRAAEVARCIEEVRQGGVDEEHPPEAQRNPRAFCESNVWVEDPRFRYDELPWIVGTLGMPLLMLGWLVGASFIGAEWHSRGMTTTLTWEPRRIRVLVSKLIALVAVVFTWTLLLQLIFAAALYPAARLEGTLASVDARWLGDMATLVVRIGALGAGAATMGFAVATIGRNTAAAFGAGFVYLAAVEGVVRGFKPQWAEWLVGDNAVFFLIGGEAVDHIEKSQAAAGLLLALYAAVVFAGALLVFLKREVA